MGLIARKLFIIFAISTNYIKVIRNCIMGLVALIVLLLITWFAMDYTEVYFRNQVIAQQQIVNITHNAMRHDRRLQSIFLTEQQKLIDYKREYDNIRESHITSVFLGKRPDVSINLNGE